MAALPTICIDKDAAPTGRPGLGLMGRAGGGGGGGVGGGGGGGGGGGCSI